MSVFKTQLSIVILPRTLFPWQTGDNVPLGRYRVDSFQVFKMTVNDQNLILKTSEQC